MLNYARSLVGKPFSNIGMARSIVFPRHTDGSSFFCAGKLTIRLNLSCCWLTVVFYVRRTCRFRLEEGRADVRFKI